MLTSLKRRLYACIAITVAVAAFLLPAEAAHLLPDGDMLHRDRWDTQTIP